MQAGASMHACGGQASSFIHSMCFACRPGGCRAVAGGRGGGGGPPLGCGRGSGAGHHRRGRGCGGAHCGHSLAGGQRCAGGGPGSRLAACGHCRLCTGTCCAFPPSHPHLSACCHCRPFAAMGLSVRHPFSLPAGCVTFAQVQPVADVTPPPPSARGLHACPHCCFAQVGIFPCFSALPSLLFLFRCDCASVRCYHTCLSLTPLP